MIIFTKIELNSGVKIIYFKIHCHEQNNIKSIYKKERRLPNMLHLEPCLDRILPLLRDDEFRLS
jgi:hypothetical protein